MEYKSELLERRLERPCWKQWLPGYGLYQAIKDLDDGKPTFINTHLHAYAVYQAVSIPAVISIGGGAIILGLYKLAEKLF